MTVPLEKLLRELAPQVLGALVRRYGHFDTAEDAKAYLHRSGRTARAGAAGIVVSLVPNTDRRTVARMQRMLEIPGPLTSPDLAALGVLVSQCGPGVERKQPSIAVQQSKPTAQIARTRQGCSATSASGQIRYQG